MGDFLDVLLAVRSTPPTGATLFVAECEVDFRVVREREHHRDIHCLLALCSSRPMTRLGTAQLLYPNFR
jgi:hypothetical protein